MRGSIQRETALLGGRLCFASAYQCEGKVLTAQCAVWQDGEKKDELVGASKEKLAELVNKYTSDEKTDHKKL